MNYNQNSRWWWIALFFGFMLLTQNMGFFPIVLLLGLLWFARSMMENQGTSAGGWSRYGDSRSRQRGYYERQQDYDPIYEDPVEEVAPRPANTDQVHDHALDAVSNAGRDPETLQVLPVDLGVLSFKGDQEPVIHRTWSVDDDVDYIQPFVQLRLPRAAKGRVRFELVDSTGQSLFVHEDNYQLERGRNLVVPNTRLPVHDAQVMDGVWKLLISADGMLIANHTFEWDHPTAGSKPAPIRQHIEEDGEISSELRAALAENRLQKMSIDELLSFQEDEGSQQSQSKS